MYLREFVVGLCGLVAVLSAFVRGMHPSKVLVPAFVVGLAYENPVLYTFVPGKIGLPGGCRKSVAVAGFCGGGKFFSFSGPVKIKAHEHPLTPIGTLCND